MGELAVKHLLNLFEGFAMVVARVPNRRYQIDGGGFSSDQARLRGDIRRFGRDVHVAVTKARNQAYGATHGR